MKTRAALLFEQPGKWEITEIDVEPPRQDELVIRMVAAGLCHSDDHITTGDLPFAGSFPAAGGHEGAGIVEEVGPHTPGWQVGDKVVLSFLPACGVCKWCASGLQNLCDSGARVLSGVREDGSNRLWLDGKPVGQMAGLSTFSERSTVSVMSCVKVWPDTDLVAACLTSCGVPTGWGAAVNSANVRPGDVVIVCGVGGIGMNAIQGAADAGAAVLIAVDPVEWKRLRALDFGATHAVASMDEAAEIARQHSNGQGADAAIVCVGVTAGEHVTAAVESIRKAGTCVLVGMGRFEEDTSIPVPVRHVVLYQKRIQGALFGSCSPTKDIPALLELNRLGRLKLGELITTRYSLDEINQGFQDLRSGRNIRGVVSLCGNRRSMIPQAMHVGTVDVPWVPNIAYPGTWFRLLQADLEVGLYTMHGRMGAGLSVGTHRHHGAVHMITLSGSWRYLEHGFLNTAGSYLYEPPGSVHTLEVPATNTELTETYSVIYGVTEYLDAAGEVVGVSDASAALRGYLESCEAAGVPRPEGIIR